VVSQVQPVVTPCEKVSQLDRELLVDEAVGSRRTSRDSIGWGQPPLRVAGIISGTRRRN